MGCYFRGHTTASFTYEAQARSLFQQYVFKLFSTICMYGALGSWFGLVLKAASTVRRGAHGGGATGAVQRSSVRPIPVPQSIKCHLKFRSSRAGCRDITGSIPPCARSCLMLLPSSLPPPLAYSLLYEVFPFNAFRLPVSFCENEPFFRWPNPLLCSHFLSSTTYYHSNREHFLSITTTTYFSTILLQGTKRDS